MDLVGEGEGEGEDTTQPVKEPFSKIEISCMKRISSLP